MALQSKQLRNGLQACLWIRQPGIDTGGTAARRGEEGRGEERRGEERRGEEMKGEEERALHLKCLTITDLACAVRLRRACVSKLSPFRKHGSDKPWLQSVQLHPKPQSKPSVNHKPVLIRAGLY